MSVSFFTDYTHNSKLDSYDIYIKNKLYLAGNKISKIFPISSKNDFYIYNFKFQKYIVAMEKIGRKHLFYFRCYNRD